jgi:hypothetical protein
MTVLNNNPAGGRCVVTADGGAGSSGKGSLNSWLADKHPFHLATNNWMTNAGHYTELDNGVRILVQHIPSAFINPNTQLYINAGGAIDIKVLYDEIQMLEQHGYNIKNRLTIHPHCNVITQQDQETEKQLIKTGSTFKGCGASLAGKSLRQDQNGPRKLAKDYEQLTPYIKNRTQELNEQLGKGMRILVEGSQGIDLDINHAEFPYTTSRQTHTTQLIADAGLPCNAVTNIIINLRTNPIRINNKSYANPQETCYTGNYWDGKEISWEQIATQAGWDNTEDFLKTYNYAILTSVTKMRRRIFEFPKQRFKFIHAISGGCLPNTNLLYSLNFLNFIDKNTEGQTEKEKILTPKIKTWLNNNMLDTIQPHQLRWLRTGPKHSQILELENGL